MIDGRTPVELSPMRRTIARRMSESKQRVPHFYETVVVEMDSVLAGLSEINAARATGERVTVTAVLVHALAETLIEHTSFNAIWQGDELVRRAAVNIGVAIDVPDGLLAPALLGCEGRDLESVAAGLRDLVARTKAGKIRAPEWADATFTLSNLGMFEIAQFTAIVVPPQVAILAVGRAIPAAVVRDGAVVIRQVIQATLSADHRAVDGVGAARFLGTLKGHLENPGWIQKGAQGG
ncbi:MAG TPA: 2-oxo acid dehydrogenase subunit E2 [Candidatus Polarisedimenticolia bacterium]|nr:2-oxo acid dehydrogenase subunit E2 [Candidatus Polarisedimenticolia bacterium]